MHTRGQFRTSVTALAGLALALALALPPASSADTGQALQDDRLGPPVALTGRLPAADATVSVEVILSGEAISDLPDGANVPSWVLPQRAVSRHGSSYSVHLGPSSVPSRFRSDDGVVTFRIRAADPSGRFWTTTTSARIVAPTAGTRPVWAEPVTSVGRPSGHRRAGDSGVDVGSLTSMRSKPSLGRALVSGHRQSLADSDCPYHQIQQREVVWATIGTSYPIGGSVARMDVDSSQGARYGTAGSVIEYHPRRTGSAYADGSWAFAWRWDRVARSYRKQVEYVLHRWGTRDSNFRCHLEWEWIPSVETGGVSSNRRIPRPRWTTCAPVPKGTWTRIRSDGHPYSYGVGVSISSIIGFNLSVRRNYSKPQRIVYDIRGPGLRRMCGNNAYPSLSGKQMERYR